MKAVLPIGLVAIVLSAGCGTTTQIAADAGGAGGTSSGGGDGATGTGGKVVVGDDGGTAGCGNDSLKAGNTTVMLQFGGVARDYIVYVPASYDGSQRVPLVLDIQGGRHGIHRRVPERAERVVERRQPLLRDVSDDRRRRRGLHPRRRGQGAAGRLHRSQAHLRHRSFQRRGHVASAGLPRG
jgi:hypothetical protein